MAFKPGAEWRGNASGRPKKTEEQIKFERKCREWAELFAIDKLKKVADTGKPMEALAAVKELLDRGFGKSEAISYIDANVTTPVGTSPDESAREIEEMLGRGIGTGAGCVGPNPVDSGK